MTFAQRALKLPPLRWLKPRPAGLTDTTLPRGLNPVSREWGYDRGLPVDRYYVEGFLARNAEDVRGRVLEIGDDSYTKRFGGAKVTQSDVLDIDRSNPKATIIADLNRANDLPEAAFDAMIFTQTLHLIYDFRAALTSLHRTLKPGGVLLATFPGISPISVRELPGLWHWNFTSNSAKKFVAEAFPGGDVRVESFGNVLTACAFLYGLAAEELTTEELDYRDAPYEAVVAVRAVKAGALGS